MKVLILVDKLNWSYHSIAQSIKKYNNTNTHLDIEPVKGNISFIKKKYKKYNLVFVMGWQICELVKFIPADMIITGIHSFHSWDKNKTTPDKSPIPPKKLINYLNQFRSINTVSKRLYDVFANNGLPSIIYTANGVDTEIFKNKCIRPIGKRIVVGYSGSKAHDYNKGVSEFILPAAKKANADVKIAMLSTGNYVHISKMHKFYNELDCYICASSSEGMSLSVLEAAACGCPIITTRCSGNVEIIKGNETGFFVDRDVDAITEKIILLQNDSNLLLKMSNAISSDIELNWGWNIRASKWINFINSNIAV